MSYLFWFSLVAPLFCKSCEAFCVPGPVLIPAEVLHLENLGFFNLSPRV